MGIIAQYGIAHVVVMGGLHVVEQYHVLQLAAVAHHAVRAHQRRAADERAVAHLRLGADDAGRAQVCRREDLRRLVDPHVLADLLVILAQGRPQREYEILDALQRLPGIGELGQVIFREGVIEVVEIGNVVHVYLPP